MHHIYFGNTCIAWLIIEIKKSGLTTPKIKTTPISISGGIDSNGLTVCRIVACGLSMKIKVKKFLTMAYTKKQSRNITIKTIHHLPEIISDLKSINSVMNKPDGGMATIASNPASNVRLPIGLALK